MSTPIGMANLEGLMNVAGLSTAPLVHLAPYVHVETKVRGSADGDYRVHHCQAFSVVSTVVDGTLYLGVVPLAQWTEDTTLPDETFKALHERWTTRWKNGHQIVHSWVAQLCQRQQAMLVLGLPMIQYGNPAVSSLNTQCEVLGWDEESKAYFDLRGERPRDVAGGE